MNSIMNKKIFYSIALSAAALCMTGCADGDLAPDSNAYEYTDSVKALQYLNDYAPLKSYVDRTVSPDFKLAIGVGAQNYVDGKIDCRLANTNFDEMSAGNAMKYGSCVKSDGTMDFSLVKKFVEAATVNNMTVFGHTLAWHSQQQNGYLKGLVAGSKKNYVLHINTPEPKANDWDWSVTVALTDFLKRNTDYTLVMKVKASSAFKITCWPLFDGGAQYWPTPSVDATTAWTQIKSTFKTNGDHDINQLQFVFGKFGGDLWFDDVQLLDADGNNFIDNGSFDDNTEGWSFPSWLKLTMAREDDPDPVVDPDAPSPKETITNALDTWINGMMEACDGKVTSWDVVNEAISGTDKDGDGILDLQSATRGTVSKDDAKNNFYWQDYMGDLDYVRSAVASARKHFAEHNGDPAKLKLFINDYNLESFWDDNWKMKSLIEWIKRWEADGVTKIDGIASQMHVAYSEDPATQKSREDHIVKMYQLMASTGKLCKVSELDMGYVDKNGNAVPTKNMTDAQQKQMADFYQFIVEKYFEIIPAAQRYGITQWCITDAPENSGWRKGEPVGLWTLNYDRKRAYGGFAEGLKKSSVPGDPSSAITK